MAWSDLCLEDFDAEYWNRLWRWYYAGGLDAVAAHLSDLAGYDAIKAIGANRCQRRTASALWGDCGMNMLARH